MDLRSGCAIELVLCISMPMWKKGQLDYYMKKNVRCSHGYFYALFAVPTMIYILLFKFVPFAGNIIAFLDYKLLKGIWESEWIGLQHFVRLFQSDIFWNALDNTLHLNLLDLLIGFPFTIILSLALALMRDSLREKLQTVLYIPYFISWAALGGIIVQMLSPSIGIVAAVGKLFSIDHSDLPILLGNKSSWVAVYVLAGIWQYAGWGTIVYVNAILGIDKHLYESAQIDGASVYQRMRYITLPLIMPTVLVMLLLKISGILSTNFEQVFALSNPMVLGISDVLSTYEYRAGLQSMQFSYATAIGLVESVIGVCFVIVSRVLIRKIDVERNIYD